MIYASHARGAITLPMLLGLVAPLEESRKGRAPARQYDYPEGINRNQKCAIRRSHMVAYLHAEGPSSCADVGEEFGMRSEAAYKDLMILMAAGHVEIEPGSKPTMWAAAGLEEEEGE